MASEEAKAETVKFQRPKSSSTPKSQFNNTAPNLPLTIWRGKKKEKKKEKEKEEEEEEEERMRLRVCSQFTNLSKLTWSNPIC